ncbi:MAG: lipoyl synthase [Calditrichaeota bacterium]|nr:lipoyl synthase [Calditrichota bacterium]MCB0302583.1 lipoyl synthase [Calditrichota bacterium]MCB0311992.1 lipoyl synthase [Calditrichota bacterium]MCB9087569.1 lipoyl synthase [Calditrichia bacterium]
MSHKRTRPDWLKVRFSVNENFRDLSQIVRDNNLHTVCQEARCPNQSECWGKGTATLMILGDVCTRSCGFCAVKTGRPPLYDRLEPLRVGLAVQKMNLKHVVITSVNRDELPDQGAEVWAETIREIRRTTPGCSVEVLIPDFKGVWEPLKLVTDAHPDILAHNTETVPRLYRRVRPQAKYDRSLWVLEKSKAAGMTTKTGIMVGLGETYDEVVALMKDLAAVEVDIFTIGQYLQPTKRHLPVARFVHPDEFAEYKTVGESLGLKHVESGPLVRSSYHAEEQVEKLNGAPACGGGNP